MAIKTWAQNLFNKFCGSEWTQRHCPWIFNWWYEWTEKAYDEMEPWK